MLKGSKNSRKIHLNIPPLIRNPFVKAAVKDTQTFLFSSTSSSSGGISRHLRGVRAPYNSIPSTSEGSATCNSFMKILNTLSIKRRSVSFLWAWTTKKPAAPVQVNAKNGDQSNFNAKVGYILNSSPVYHKAELTRLYYNNCSSKLITKVQFRTEKNLLWTFVDRWMVNQINLCFLKLVTQSAEVLNNQWTP